MSTTDEAVLRPPTFTVLTRARCLALLGSTTVGRVAFQGRDGLVVRPVNYRVVGEAVVLRTSSAGSLSELATTSAEVVFEVDHHAPTARSGWSVLVHGTASVVTDTGALASVEVARVVPWVSGEHPLVLAVSLDRVTGRSV